MKRKGGFFKTLLYIILLMYFGVGTGAAKEQGEGKTNTKIVTVDISYEFFVALASYQELSEDEKAGKNIHREIVPVLGVIIAKLRSERKKIERLNALVKTDLRLGKMLIRLDRHLDGFSKELLYRQKVLKYETLMEEQKRILEGQ